MTIARFGACLAGAFLLAAAPARAELAPVATPDLGARCDDLDLAALAGGLDAQIAALEAEPKAELRIGDRELTHAEYARGTLSRLAELARGGGDGFCAALAREFDFYRDAAAGDGSFTVYFNPTVKGSRTRGERFRHPLYRRPAGDAARLTTEQILAGGLDGEGLELVWLEDLTLVNAVQVEGSATVELEEGGTLELSCDGSNGHPYQNVGKLLVADDKIPADQETPLGMTRARKYFLDHPDELPGYWAKNPHYVFFKAADTAGHAALGGVDLVAGRSIAVDPAHVPLGAAAWIQSEKPIVEGDALTGWEAYARVALGQDTGAAIKGAGRVDVFFGEGEYAQAAAAATHRPGAIYVLVAKGKPAAKANAKAKARQGKEQR